MTRPPAALLSLLARGGAFSAARRILVGRGRFVLIFHGVCRGRRPELPRAVEPHFSAAELAGALAWLASRFEFLNPEQLLHSDRPGVLLTFDDGFANNVTNVIPVLERFSAPAVFFVAVQHVVDPRNWLPFVRKQVNPHWSSPDLVPDDVAADLFDGMSLDQLAEAARHPLITIAAHTIHHPFLTRIPLAEAQRELETSRALLQRMTDRPVTLFAYPHGDYDRRVAELIHVAGYDAAFVDESRSLGLPAAEIPRVGIYSAEPQYLDAKLSGLFRAPLRSQVL